MQYLKRHPIVVAGLAALLLIIGLLWSTRLPHTIKKIVSRAKLRASEWRGATPRLVLLTGKTRLPGAQVQALDSDSGWATLCDSEGGFKLPDVMWYAGVTYELIVSTDYRGGKLISVAVPSIYPDNGVIDVGEIDPAGGMEVDLSNLAGVNSITLEGYDFKNRDYYRRVFDELTIGKQTDEAMVEAVNQFVATKLNYRETQWELGSPRRIIEHGSQYCSHLSAAMASILAAGYCTRLINLSDGADPPQTHVVIEAYYKGGWHLYDPTFGIHFTDSTGKVVSYRDVRLDPRVIRPELFFDYTQDYPAVALDWLTAVYASGFHHFYYSTFKCSQYAHAWLNYKDGLDYVPSGGRAWLAAAGIRPGSAVTYHIRRPGLSVDELTLRTQKSSNSACVLNQEESPPIELPPGEYDVFADFEDGNVPPFSTRPYTAITGWRLRKKFSVK
jgi:transglutaminase superfamily protein